jgi:cyclic peptide transporter
MDIVRSNIRQYIFFIVLSIVAAGANMCVIYAINSLIRLNFLGGGSIPAFYYFLFPASLVVFFVSRWIVSMRITGFTQSMLRKAKLSMLHITLRSPYLPLMKNKESIITAMTRDSANIVNASISMVDIATNLVIVLICFVYMAFLSWKLLLCIAGLIALTVVLYAFGEKKAYALFNKAMTHDDRFIRYMNEILAGFKEIVIDRKKGFDIESRQVTTAIDSSVMYNRRAFTALLNNRIIGQMGFYVFIGMLMLFLGKALSVDRLVLVNFVFLTMYVFGPIETVTILIPSLSQAKTSLGRLNALKAQLESHKAEDDDGSAVRPDFESLAARDIHYRYQADKEEEPFSVGPVNFSVSAGDTVFIYGGNGSGKTTFINLLIGLFAHDSGEFFINGQRIGSAQSYAYRSLFAPVFSDFHLFDECYGMESIDRQKAEEYIELFDLAGKVSVEGRGFTTIDLSTGQRKRLALICALLEKKPVLILDEFAADQDPFFRKKFYLEILAVLKREGFTVIAITHDDSYYHCCDLLYRMDYGKITRAEKFHLGSEPPLPVKVSAI